MNIDNFEEFQDFEDALINELKTCLERFESQNPQFTNERIFMLASTSMIKILVSLSVVMEFPEESLLKIVKTFYKHGKDIYGK